MSDSTLETAIAKILQSPFVQEEIEFLWHAGEPLAAGLPYYESAVKFIRMHNTRGLKVIKSIQTNGTLITSDWCRFFAEHNFSIGLSIDGPAFLHNAQRKNWAGHDSHREVMRGLYLLRDHGITPGAICVLTRESLRYPSEIFHFFLEHGFRHLAFNVEEVENNHRYSSLARPSHENSESIVREYRHFISEVYDLWQLHADELRIREFDDIINIIREKLGNSDFVRRPLETTELGIITIQKSGNISTFSPEFAGGKSRQYADFIVGNILDGSLEDIPHNPVFQKIRNDMLEGMVNCARTCLYFDLCGGAYVSNKYFENDSLQSTETTACILHRQTLASLLIEKLTT